MMISKPRVVITGVGVLCSIGHTVEEFGESLYAGRTCFARLRDEEILDQRYAYGGVLRDFDIAREMPDVDPKRVYRYSQFALVAADRAFKDAALSFKTTNPDRIGTGFGTSIGSSGELFEGEGRKFISRGVRAVSPLAWSEGTWGSCTTHIAIQFGLRGPTATISAGCVTSIDTVAWGMQQIQEGNADAVLVGGTDTQFHPFIWATMCRSGILAPTLEREAGIPRPFSHDHNGIGLIEGATAILLESEAHARMRGARIRAEVLGYGNLNSGSPLLEFDLLLNSFVTAIRLGLHDAGLPPREIDWVCAHGTGNPIGDVAESQAIEKAFGEHAFCIPVSSIRGAIGQPLASGGGFQIAAACHAIAEQRVPPTINFDRPADGCRLDYVPNHARVSRVRKVLINGAGIGGAHSELVVGAYEG